MSMTSGVMQVCRYVMVVMKVQKMDNQFRLTGNTVVETTLQGQSYKSQYRRRRWSVKKLRDGSIDKAGNGNASYTVDDLVDEMKLQGKARLEGADRRHHVMLRVEELHVQRRNKTRGVKSYVKCNKGRSPWLYVSDYGY
ncbi:hypothetical protein AKJ16_DCAP02136 [Drosera capensis]